MQVGDTVISWVSCMSPQEREDFYLILACHAEERGALQESAAWLDHAENKTNWRKLEEQDNAG